MIYLLIFIAGILFASLVIPLLNGLLEWLLLVIEAKKAKLTELVNESNIKIQKAANKAMEEEAPPMHAIGFVTSDDDYYTEGEEDEDDL